MQAQSTPSPEPAQRGHPNGVSSMRAIAYLRVSTDVQTEGFGLDVQRDKVTTYAREHGLELIDVVQESASGGVRDGEDFSWEHRPQLLSIMDGPSGESSTC